MLARRHLKRDDIEYVNVARGAEVRMLAAGQVDAVFGYSFGQALTLTRAASRPRFSRSDYGVKFYGTVIYTNEGCSSRIPIW